jgi:hypothetical protein
MCGLLSGEAATVNATMAEAPICRKFQFFPLYQIII